MPKAWHARCWRMPVTATPAPVGGSVRLSLYGVNPVEVSRNVATVNLAANALQLSRDALYLACQAIANTLTTLPEIEWVNFLVVDRPVGLDIANTLPMGAFSATTAQDIGAAYEQLLSRRVDSGSDASLKPLTSNVTLYFPVSGMDGVVSEVRSVSFSDQVFSNMVVAILRELAQGPTGEIDSPPCRCWATCSPPTPCWSIPNPRVDRSLSWSLPITWMICWKPTA